VASALRPVIAQELTRANISAEAPFDQVHSAAVDPGSLEGRVASALRPVIAQELTRANISAEAPFDQVHSAAVDTPESGSRQVAAEVAAPEPTQEAAADPTTKRTAATADKAAGPATRSRRSK